MSRIMIRSMTGPGGPGLLSARSPASRDFSHSIPRHRDIAPGFPGTKPDQGRAALPQTAPGSFPPTGTAERPARAVSHASDGSDVRIAFADERTPRRPGSGP